MRRSLPNPFSTSRALSYGAAVFLFTALAVLFAPFALSAGEAADAKIARLPGVPAVPVLLQMLQQREDYKKRLAAGFLRMLPAEDMPELHAAWKPMVGELNTELVRRTSAPALDFTANYVLNGTNNNQEYFTKLIRELNSDELKPLAKAVHDQLKKSGQWRYLRFVDLAGKSGEPSLLALAMQNFEPPQNPSTLKDLFANGQSDASLGALRPFALSGPKNRRLAALAALPHGWNLAPDAGWSGLLRDPDPHIRQTFIQSLFSSSNPAALALAEQALSDTDQNVATTAASAISCFQGTEADASLQRLAMDKRLPATSRANIWRTLATRHQSVLVKEAQALFLDRAQDRTLRAAAAGHLNNQEGANGEWVLSNLSRVEPELQSTLLTEMSTSQSKEVLAKVPSLVTRLDAKLGAPVLRALSSRHDPEAVELLINALQDARPEIQAASQDALSSATGLALQRQTFSADPRAPKLTPQQVYTRWHTWSSVSENRRLRN